MVQAPQNADTSGRPVEPIIKFADAHEFRVRHAEATKAEFDIQKRKVDWFNKKNPVLDAWVITAPPAKQSWMGYILRVHLDGKREDIGLPGIGQSCKLRLVKSDKTSSSWFSCRTGAEIVNLNQTWNNLTEFVAYPPETEIEKFEDCLVPLLDGSLPAKTLHKNNKKAIKVQLHLEASKATMLAELGALERLTMGRASTAGAMAFSYLMDFKEPRRTSDLTTSFPHLANLEEVADSRVRQELREVIDGFDDDQRKAFAGISHLAAQICFVPGGPGSGKTWWSLTMAFLAQSGGKRCQTLYLLDITKPVDDAADRMYAMCRKFDSEKSVIRVHGWPFADVGTIDVEEDLQDDGKVPRTLRHADFTEGFLRAMRPILPRDVEKAPTLDERAWECFSDQPEKYGEVDSALGKVLAADHDAQDSLADMSLLRASLISLYSEVLNQADFIATTPVTAPRLHGTFNPDIVIFDECAHARELSTMISLAYFNPKAWFFVGDHRQTEPFVGTYSKYAPQLKMSTMERADKAEAVSYQLLVNHRAYGGLERLASGLFYDGAMRSEKEGDELLPPSVKHLRHWLSTLATGNKLLGDLRVPRLIVSGWRGSEEQQGTSSWNPKHQEFIMKQVDALLHDRAFVQIDSSEPGTIMILSPYKAAVQHYEGSIKRLPTRQMKRRVQVRTVDTAQGQEADVVFLDMVRTRASTHTENAKRLCVALTRARQAEIIMMNRTMVDNHMYGMDECPKNLNAVWRKCQSGEEGAVLSIPDPSRRLYGGFWGGWDSEW
jgi:regulator of nonsense transcripts 1